MKYKRLKIACVALGVNFLILLLGMVLKTDLGSLGGAIALINAPLYAFILGDTWRKSE